MVRSVSVIENEIKKSGLSTVQTYSKALSTLRGKKSLTGSEVNEMNRLDKARSRRAALDAELAEAQSPEAPVSSSSKSASIETQTVTNEDKKDNIEALKEMLVDSGTSPRRISYAIERITRVLPDVKRVIPKKDVPTKTETKKAEEIDSKYLLKSYVGISQMPGQYLRIGYAPGTKFEYELDFDKTGKGHEFGQGVPSVVERMKYFKLLGKYNKKLYSGKTGLERLKYEATGDIMVEYYNHNIRQEGEPKLEMTGDMGKVLSKSKGTFDEIKPYDREVNYDEAMDEIDSAKLADWKDKSLQKVSKEDKQINLDALTKILTDCGVTNEEDVKKGVTAIVDAVPTLKKVVPPLAKPKGVPKPLPLSEPPKDDEELIAVLDYLIDALETAKSDIPDENTTARKETQRQIRLDLKKFRAILLHGRVGRVRPSGEEGKKFDKAAFKKKVGDLNIDRELIDKYKRKHPDWSHEKIMEKVMKERKNHKNKIYRDAPIPKLDVNDPELANYHGNWRREQSVASSRSRKTPRANADDIIEYD